jgi:hypothetical protein
MLNDQLTQRLHEADRGFQRQTSLTLGLRLLKYLVALLVVLFALDVVLHLNAAWRLAIGLAFAGVLLALGSYLFYLAQVRRHRPEHVARLLESRDASLGSRLINFLQLREQAATQPPLTRALAERAIGDYTASLQTRDFAPLTKSPTLPRDLRYAALAVGCFALLLCVVYPVSILEFLRFVDPFGDHPAYSFTQIELVEPADGVQVDYNGEIVIKARTTGHRPDDLFLRYADPAQPNAVTAIPMYGKGELGFMQAIENVKTDLLVTAATKNGRSVSKSRRIKVGLTPKIERAFVEIKPPAYTGIAARETKYEFKNLTALVGSEIKFRLQSNRPLSAGGIVLAEAPSTLMKSTAENEVTGTVVAKDSARLQFSVVDAQGHPSVENPTAPLTVTHDLPPEITIEAPAQDAFVCDDFVVEVRISASDDYGLKTVRIHRALNDVFSAPKIVNFTEITRSTGESLTLDIKQLGVQPGDTIAIFAEAVDTCPEPHLTRTRTLHLMVISTEEYNNYLRERTDISDIQGKYTKLLNQFQDLIDEQKELTEQLKAAQEKAKDPATSKETAAQLDKLMQKQAELNKKLGAIADEMDHFVRDKPLYDVESELQNKLAETAGKIRESVGKNDEALRKKMEEAAQSSPPSQKQQADALATLEDESRKQVDALQPQQEETESDIIPIIKDMALINALINDFNAIKYLYDTQSTIAAQVKAYENRVEPTDEDKLALKQLAASEKAIQWALDKVVDNLRDHADAAEKAFPKAAEGARDLANQIDEQKISDHAGRAAITMLTANGAESSARAEGVREELEKLFAEAGEPGEAKLKSELDQYLKLHRGLNGSNTFGQMSQSRKFGLGRGQGQAQGQGQGNEGGLDGYATSSGGNFGVFGNETLGGDPKEFGQGKNGLASNAGPGSKVEVNKTDAVVPPGTSRESGSVKGESALEEYRGVIEAYFNSITK